MTVHPTTLWVPPRWLYRLAVCVVVLTFVMLSVGALVTSFRAGMSDTTWPRTPWHLFVIKWENWGLVIEHTHRFVGILLGLSVAALALGLWATETNPGLKWAGVVAIVVLLAAFGQMHATLIARQNELRDLGEPPVVDWRSASGPTTVALTVLLAVVAAELFAGSPGRKLRALAVVALVFVMVQGLLGGLRVLLNAIAGTAYSIAHAAFSQVVIATLLAVAVSANPRQDSERVDPALARFATWTALLLYAQVVAGAFLRHAASPLAARAHLLGAFASTAFVILLARALRSPTLLPAIRKLRVVMHIFLGLQILLGIEAWMMRFGGGFAAAEWRTVSWQEAATRTLHTLIGYGLFAAAARTALMLRRDCAPTAPLASRFGSPELEAVA